MGFESVRFERGGRCMKGTDLDALKSLLKGECHATGDNERVDLDRNTFVSDKRDR